MSAWSVDRKALAEVLGVSRARLDALVREGLPAERRGSKGQPWRFDLRRAVAWWGAYRERLGAGQAADGSERLDPAQERARKDKVERELRELDLARQRGELQDALAMQETWTAALSALCARLRTIPTKAAPRAAEATSTPEAAAVLREEVDAVLRELSEAEVPRSLEEQEEDEA